MPNENFLNRPLYREVVRSGNLGGGFRGFLDRLFRGAAQGAVPNTVGEFIGYGGPIGSGLNQGIRQGVTGSAWYQRLVRGNPYFSNDSMYPSELEDWQRAPGSGEGGALPGMPSGPNRPTSGVPSWMLPGASMPQQQPYQPNWPGAGTWPGQQNNPYYGEGQGMMRMPGANPQRGPQSNVGPRGGQTIATGTAAQNMVEGWQQAAQDAQMNALLAEARRRAMAMQQ